MLATTSFLKKRGVKPVSFCPTEVVMLGPIEVVMVSLGLAEVVMIINTLDMMLAEFFAESSLRDNNKDDDDNEPHHSGLIT